jgi:TolB-like protein/Flp pilus assembly protein TadD
LPGPDIFLSYNRDDQAIAQCFAEAFEAAGLSVWWDVTLRSGEAYDRVTEEALRTAKAVVVLWSPRSVDSRWVRAEASIADENGTLVPATIDPCQLPVMFRLTQTADLSHWRGEMGDAAWQAFLGDTKRLVEAKVEPMVLKGGAPAAVEALPKESLRPSMAVLPFINRSRNDEDNFFAQDMVEDLTATLSRDPMVAVVAANATAKYATRMRDLCQIGRDLGVTYLLEGNVRRMAEVSRLTVQLVQADTGNIVWSAKFDRPAAELFARQEELVAEVAANVAVTIERANWSHALRTPEKPTSVDAHLRAVAHVIRMTRAGYEAAVAEARRAVELDPNFGTAHGGLAMMLAYLWRARGCGDAELAREAAEAIARARVLDPDDPITLVACSGALIQLGRARDALPLIKRALATNPTLYYVRATLGLVLVQLGQAEDGLAEFDESERLAPNSIWASLNSIWRSVACLQMGRADEAMEAAEKVLVLAPGNIEALLQCALCRALVGDWTEARDAIGRLCEADPGASRALVEGFVRFLHNGSDKIEEYVAIVGKLWNEGECVR